MGRLFNSIHFVCITYHHCPPVIAFESFAVFKDPAPKERIPYFRPLTFFIVAHLDYIV